MVITAQKTVKISQKLSYGSYVRVRHGMIFLKSSVLCKLLTIDFITGKLRYFFNCHDPEQIQEYTELGILGVGRIHRNNSSEVEKMVNAVRYLVRPEKDAQHLRVKCKAKMRTFQ